MPISWDESNTSFIEASEDFDIIETFILSLSDKTCP